MSTLKGFSRPFSPQGLASLLPPLPLDAAMSSILVHFRADPAELESLIPGPLEPGPRAGEAFIISVDHLITPAEDPGRFESEYLMNSREILIGVPCEFRGKPGIFYPYVYNNRDWGVLYGWLTGLCSKLASIEFTPIKPLHPHYAEVKPGLKFTSTASRIQDRLITMGVEVEREVSPDQLPIMELLHGYFLRHIPDLNVENYGKPLVHDIAHESQENTRIGPAWSGRGHLKFGASENEELERIQPTEILGGYLMSFGYRVNGIKVIYDYLKES